MGFLPAHYMSFSGDYSKFDVLLLKYQDCTGCATWKVIKGKMLIDTVLYPKNLYPIKQWEVETLNFQVDDELVRQNLTYYDLALNRQFEVVGKVKGVIKKEKYGNYYLPQFEVKSWYITQYYPLCFLYPVSFLIFWISLGLFAYASKYLIFKTEKK